MAETQTTTAHAATQTEAPERTATSSDAAQSQAANSEAAGNQAPGNHAEGNQAEGNQAAGSQAPRSAAQKTKTPVGAQRHWDMDTDIPWDKFDPSKVDPELLKIIKAASMVEFNAWDYCTYLNNVFGDDPDAVEQFNHWAYEEVQHGQALGRWAEMADPNWSHSEHFDRFVAGFRPDIEVSQSIRGSRAGEMVARCMVEIGTSSYYGSIGQHTQEPVLQEICKRIAADELRHYKMFYKNMKRYLESENPTKIQRLRVALGRVLETEDDELAYAYYAANCDPSTDYDRETYNKAYMRRAFEYYHAKQIERAVSMTLKASGFNPQSWYAQMAARGAWWFVRYRASRLAAANA